MKSVNLLVWSAGVVLQIVLLVVLLVGGPARRFPLFTTLIAFYVVRGIALDGLFGHLTRAGYANLYDALSLADVGLQILVAAEIAICVLRGRGAWTWRRGVELGGMCMGAVAAAAAISAALPSRGPAPLDRASAFASLLLLLAGVWGVSAGAGGAVRRIGAGFAAYGGVAVLAAVERNYAALHRNRAAYAAGEYAQAGIYMAVVLFWIVALWDGKAQATRARMAPAKA